MRRSVVVLMLLFALVWQSVAHARMGSSVDVMGDLAHAVLHWQDQAHHHHDDGSYHLDDSAEARLHLIADHVPGSLAAPPADTGLRLPGGSAPPAASPPPARPTPFLEGPLRPPRAFA